MSETGILPPPSFKAYLQLANHRCTSWKNMECLGGVGAGMSLILMDVGAGRRVFKNALDFGARMSGSGSCSRSRGREMVGYR